MSIKKRSELERRLKQGGTSTDMSRSQDLGADDPRNRRGAQAKLPTALGYNPDQFTVNPDGQIELTTSIGQAGRVTTLSPIDFTSTGYNQAGPFLNEMHDKIDELILVFRAAGFIKK